MRKLYLVKKIFICFVVTILILLFSRNIAFARIPVNEFDINMEQAKQVNKWGNSILSNVQVIGIFASVAALMIIGIKYMLGSAEEKSEQKETLIFYIIGAILVFGIVNIVPFIYNIVNEIF